MQVPVTRRRQGFPVTSGISVRSGSRLHPNQKLEILHDSHSPCFGLNSLNPHARYISLKRTLRRSALLFMQPSRQSVTIEAACRPALGHDPIGFCQSGSRKRIDLDGEVNTTAGPPSPWRRPPARPKCRGEIMRKSRNPRFRDAARQLGWPAITTALAIGAQSGCTREFYREWANQDVSEAVFEKSRETRGGGWTSSRWSPPLSRFADPYDQEVPPAPPDDPAAEALSPVPQWPDNRLLVPVEGTGYLDLLEYWRRDQRRKRKCRRGLAGPATSTMPRNEPEFWQRPDNGRHRDHRPAPARNAGPALTSPAGPPVPPETASPFYNPPARASPRPGAETPCAAWPSAGRSPSGCRPADRCKPRNQKTSRRRPTIRIQVVRLQNGDRRPEWSGFRRRFRSRNSAPKPSGPASRILGQTHTI